jgi:hypothetical protein
MKKTKIIIFIILLIILISVFVFIISNCVKYVPESSFTVLKDTRTGDVRLLSPGIHFFIQGYYPDRIILRSFNNKNSSIYNIKIDIPPFDSLGKDFLCINVAFNVIYSINYMNINIASIQPDNGSYFYDAVGQIIKANLRSELLPYILPNYKPDSIISGIAKIRENVFNRTKEQCNAAGLEIEKFEISGQIELPLKETYDSEVKYLNELKDIEKNNKKELLILESKIFNEQKVNSSYYNKLQEISKIIKDNPDILKYIYIDKLADNVKIIITSDKTGIPSGLINEKIIEKGRDDIEIDNLRK